MPSDIMELEFYFQDLQQVKILSKVESEELYLKFKAGDIDARNKLIESNLRFAFSIAKSYRRKGYSFSDLLDEANIQCIRAVDDWDPEKGGAITTVVGTYVHNGLRRMLCDQHIHGMRIPRVTFQQLCNLEGHESVEEVKEKLKTTTDRAKQLIGLKRATLPTSRQEEVATFLEDSEEITKEQEQQIIVALRGVSKFDRLVFRMFYGRGKFNGNAHTKEEISTELKVSVSRISRSLNKVHRKICRRKSCEFCSKNFIVTRIGEKYCNSECARNKKVEKQRLRRKSKSIVRVAKKQNKLPKPKRLKKCKFCKIPFSPNKKTSKYCSPKCANDSRKKPPHSCSYCNKPVLRREYKYCCVACSVEAKKTLIPINCKNCNNVFLPPDFSRVFCSRKCVLTYKKGRNTNLEIKNCIRCSNSFAPYHKRNKYCSKDCYLLAIRKVSPVLESVCNSLVVFPGGDCGSLPEFVEPKTLLIQNQTLDLLKTCVSV